jgi:TolB-like protein/Tfp pilus assembly protein PilF
VGAWLVIQVTDIVGPAFNLPEWVLRAVILAAIIGFLITMGALLFRPRRQGRAASPVYLSRRARLIAGAGILAIALAAAAYSIRAFSTREQVTLAVMPFADLSPQRDKAFLAEGVAEEILSALGKESQLKVLGRTSSWALRERTGDLAALRKTLGVTHILEGSVRAAGSDLRLNVRLIRTADGAQEWTEDYKGDGQDIFAMQEKVAAAVADRLTSGGNEREKSSTPGLAAGDGYHLYLAARQTARTRTEPELKKALALARRAIAADPKYGPAQALYGQLIWMLSDAENAYGNIPQEKARRTAAIYARRAIALAPDRAEGYAVLGIFQEKASLAPLHRAIALDPSWSEPRLWLALALDSLDRHEESLGVLRQAAAIDPLFPAVISRLAGDLAFTGRFAEARRVIDRFEAQGGPPAQVARFRGLTALIEGDLSEAVPQFDQAIRIDPATPYVAGYRERALSWMGFPVRVTSRGSTVRRLYLATGPQAVADWAARTGPAVWNDPDVEILLFHLAAAGRFDLVRDYYQASLRSPAQACKENGQAALSILVALQRLSDPHAGPLMSCLSRRFALRQASETGYRWFAIQDAQMAALRGDPGRALAEIEREIAQGWSGWGKFTTRLAHFAAFETLLDDPRLKSLQARLDAHMARERREYQSRASGKLPG